MTAAMSWFVSVMGVFAFVIALHLLGYNVGANLGIAVQGTVHFLGQPLIPT